MEPPEEGAANGTARSAGPGADDAAEAAEPGHGADDPAEPGHGADDPAEAADPAESARPAEPVVRVEEDVARDEGGATGDEEDDGDLVDGGRAGGDGGDGTGDTGDTGGGGGGEEDGEEAEELGGISRLSLPSRLIVAVMVAAVAVGALFHLGMVFLQISPPNTLSEEYSKQVNDYNLPEFEQNWKLFAPNPVQDNNDVEARAQVRMPNGTLQNTGWVDLTAMDIANIRDNLIPSHTAQNELRRAWGFYTDTHDDQDRAVGIRGDLSQQYLLRIVANRLPSHLNGGTVEQFQVRVAVTPVGSPPWSSQKIATTTSYRVLPWWPVTAEDFT